MNLKAAIISKFKNGGFVLLDQAIVSGTSFVIGIMLARFLGLEIYGMFALLWMIVLFGLSISQAFITKPMLSFGPKMSEEEALKYFSSLHAIQLIFSALATLITFLGLWLATYFVMFDLPSNEILIRIPVILGLFLLYDYYRKYCFVNEQIEFVFRLDLLLSFIQISGIILFYSYSLLSLESLLGIMIFAYVISCLFGFLKSCRPVFDIRFLKYVFYKNLDFSKWLLGTALLQWLCGNFFIIAGGGILGTAAVGAIRIAQNIIGLTHVIFLAMENIIPVYAARQYQNGGIEALYQFLKKVSIQTGAIVMLILISLAALAPVLIDLLYGEEFVPFSYILVGFCLIYLLVFIGHPLRFALRTLELTKPIFIAYALGAVFSLVTAYPLLYYFEMYGLLTGMFMTQLIAQAVYLFSLLKIKNTYENHPLGTRQS